MLYGVITQRPNAIINIEKNTQLASSLYVLSIIEGLLQDHVKRFFVILQELKVKCF